MKSLEKHTESIYAVLRIVVGFMFAFHGAQKMLHLFAPEQMPAMVRFSQMWFGGIIELAGGLLVMVGLGSRWAGFICSGQMAVAYFQFHFYKSLWVALPEDPTKLKFHLGSNILPGVNNGEMAVLYCFIFLFIAAKGSGKWSLDGGK